VGQPITPEGKAFEEWPNLTEAGMQRESWTGLALIVQVNRRLLKCQPHNGELPLESKW
jgi:hypothetical protein